MGLSVRSKLKLVLCWRKGMFWILALCLLGHGMVMSGGPVYAAVSFISVLNAGQEGMSAKQRDAPPDSTALGNAILNYDESNRKVCYALSFTQLVGKETEAHFHAPASIGENAPVLFFISPPMSGGASPFGTPKVGCVGPLNKQELRWLKKGLWYLNIHTDKFPGGEIRGQIFGANSPIAK